MEEDVNSKQRQNTRINQSQLHRRVLGHSSKEHLASNNWKLSCLLGLSSLYIRGPLNLLRLQVTTKMKAKRGKKTFTTYINNDFGFSVTTLIFCYVQVLLIYLNKLIHIFVYIHRQTFVWAEKTFQIGYCLFSAILLPFVGIFFQRRRLFILSN